jgi:hypothetical protein
MARTWRTTRWGMWVSRSPNLDAEGFAAQGFAS